MKKICTSVKQSKKLVKLGLDTNTANMHYWMNVIIAFPFSRSKHQDEAVPLWSLTALLELMPELDGRNPTLNRIINTNKWWVMYHSTATLPLIRTHEHNTPIDAAYEMICILLKDKKL